MGFEADYSLYRVDNDIHNDWMYTFPNDSLRFRDGWDAAPLVYGGVEHAWRLVKKDATAVTEPKRKRDITSILGADADIDMLENLTQNAVYETRTLTDTYLLLSRQSDADHITVADAGEWESLLSEIKNFLNGIVGKTRIINSRDRGFYWLGRVTAALDSKERYRAFITITAEVEPYKYERYDSTEPWQWDDFDFSCGIIREPTDYTLHIDAGDFAILNVPMGGLGGAMRTKPSTVSIKCQRSDDTVPWHIVTMQKDGVNIFADNANGERNVDGVLHIMSNMGGDVGVYVAVVEPAGNPAGQGWYERSGTAPDFVYTPTEDTTPIEGKTYYLFYIGGFVPVVLTPVDNPAAQGWYERSGTAPDYVYSHTEDTTPVPGKTYYRFDGTKYTEAVLTPVDNPAVQGWYEYINGEYTRTEDAEPVEGKTYYMLRHGMVLTVSNDAYVAVDEPTGNPAEQNWYERSGTAPNYVYTLTEDTTPATGKTYYRYNGTSKLAVVRFAIDGAYQYQTVTLDEGESFDFIIPDEADPDTVQYQIYPLIAMEIGDRQVLQVVSSQSYLETDFVPSIHNTACRVTNISGVPLTISCKYRGGCL